MDKFLIIDTATKDGAVCLLTGYKTLLKKNLKEREQTKELVPLIKDLLNECGSVLEELKGIAVCIGPGLYTGTRIGVMTAKTLSYALDIPLYPFSTFDIYREKGELAALDAKCNRAYLLQNEELKIVSYEELSEIKTPVHTLNASPFKALSTLFITTEKDFMALSSLLPNIPAVTHDQITVLYPADSNG